MQRTMNSRRVEEHDLRVGIISHAENPRTRRLRLVRHDGELLADEAVEERRFAGVRTSDEGDEAPLHGAALASAAAGAGSIFFMRTRVMRRRSASTTSTLRPSISKCSPTVGTRPILASR